MSSLIGLGDEWDQGIAFALHPKPLASCFPRYNWMSVPDYVISGLILKTLPAIPFKVEIWSNLVKGHATTSLSISAG